MKYFIYVLSIAIPSLNEEPLKALATSNWGPIKNFNGLKIMDLTQLSIVLILLIYL